MTIHADKPWFGDVEPPDDDGRPDTPWSDDDARAGGNPDTPWLDDVERTDDETDKPWLDGVEHRDSERTDGERLDTPWLDGVERTEDDPDIPWLTDIASAADGVPTDRPWLDDVVSADRGQTGDFDTTKPRRPAPDVAGTRSVARPLTRAERNRAAAADAAVSPRTTQTLERRRMWERRYRTRLRITDAVIIVLATMTPILLQYLGSPQPHSAAEMWEFVARFGIAGLVAIVWYGTISVFRTREATIFGSGASEYKRLGHATTLAFGALAIAFVLFTKDGLRTQLIFALPIGLFSLVLGRWLWRRWLLHERKYGHYVSRTIVVGNREDVEYVIETLHRAGQLAYLVVGAILTDDDGRQLRVDGRWYAVVGSPRTVARTAAKFGADTIIVASLDDDDPYAVKRLSWQLEGTAADLVLGSRLTDVAGPRISLRPIDGLPLIQVKIPTFEGGQYAIKRTLDIVVASLGVLATGIIALPLALIIRLDSPGPVFFRQERVGRDGATFKMLKFRTMRVDAEEMLAQLQAQNDGAGPLFKMHDDPRVTRVGRILRKLSLDELPQFWNVLIGDMSVVGPRPPLPNEVTAYNGAVYRRLYIKPGITGLWQISGRSDLAWDESVRLDLRYVENWSILSDIIIMWRTVRVMVMPRGAY